MALKYFYKCDEACRKVDKDGPSGFMAATNINIGKIYDLQGKRDLAKKQYQKVLSWKDVSDSHKEAQKFMNKPYGK
jgi:predicted negative regulator of RcsB-dependent stress response